MHTHSALLVNHTLLSLTLPGTHDSGSNSLTTTLGPVSTGSAFLDAVIELADKLHLPVSDVLLPWALSQPVDVAGQLCMGARYLDVRAAWDGSTWRIYHGLLGVSLAEVLNDVTDFVSRQQGEVVVVEISHLAAVEGVNITADAVIQLNATIANTFGKLLYRPSTPSFTQHTIGQLVAMNQRVVLSLSADLLQPPLDMLSIVTPFKSTALFNTYADTPSLTTMQNYNLLTLLSYSLPPPQPATLSPLHKLSYTLTPDADTVLDSWIPGQPATLEALAGLAGGVVLDGVGSVGGWRRDGLLSSVEFGGLLGGLFGSGSGAGVIVLMDWFESQLVDECIRAMQNDRTLSLSSEEQPTTTVT